MKRFLASVLAIMLVIGMMSSASALVLRKGATGATVLAVQNYLNNNGYGYLVPDGKYGTKTMAAVRAFQTANGLKVDGLAGPKTLAAMGIAGSSSSSSSTYPKLKLGSEGSSVAYLQQLLQRYNYRPGYADGVFGNATRTALMRFQQLNGLTVDGVCGSSTWSKLLSGDVVIFGVESDDETTNEDFFNFITGVVLSNLTPRVGQALSASIIPSTGTASYVWYRVDENGQNVKVGTGKTYTPTAMDVNCQLFCVATGTGMTNGSATSASSGPVTTMAGNYPQDGTLTLPTTVRVDDTIRPTLAGTTNTNVKYNWYLNGTLVAKDAVSFKVTSSMLNANIYVVAEAVANSGYTGSVMSNIVTVQQKLPSLPVEDEANDAGVMSGEISLPSVVRAGTSVAVTIESEIPCKNYQVNWFLDGTNVYSGNVYVVPADAAGKSLYATFVAIPGSGYQGAIATNVVTVQ